MTQPEQELDDYDGDPEDHESVPRRLVKEIATGQVREFRDRGQAIPTTGIQFLTSPALSNLNGPEVSVRDFLRILFKRKNAVLVFFVFCVTLVTGGSIVIAPIYEAEATILVKIGRENVYTPDIISQDRQAAVVTPDRTQIINSEIEILKSHYLLEKVVDTLGATTIYKDLAHPPAGFIGYLSRFLKTTRTPGEEAMLRLQARTSIEGAPNSDIIHVSFKHKDPKIASDVVNTLAKLYFDFHLQVHQVRQSHDFFLNQSKLLEAKLRQEQAELDAYMKQQELTDPSQEKKLLLTHEAQLRAELDATRSQEAELESRVNQLRSQLIDVPQTVTLETEVDHTLQVISNLNEKLAQVEVNEQELRSKYSSESPILSQLLRELQSQKDALNEKVQEQEGKGYNKSRTGTNPVYQDIQQKFFKDQAELASTSAKKQSQIAQLGEYRASIERINKADTDFNNLREKVEADQKNYQLYLAKLEESRISHAMDVEKMSNVTLVDPAVPPVEPLFPKIGLNIILSVFLGCLGGLGLAFLMEYFSDYVETVHDVENWLSLPVIASISDSPLIAKYSVTRCVSASRRRRFVAHRS